MARRQTDTLMERAIMEMKNCEKHGPYQPELVQIFGITIESRCPFCSEEEAAAEDKLDQERRQQARREGLIKRGIEPEFFNANLEQYKAENATERAALKACTDLKDGRCRKVLLLGSNGTGKTLLANALALELKGVRITMYELSARIRQGYNNGRGELDVMDELLTYPFIAIDEIGRTKGSDAELNWLSYLIDKAHTRGIRLLLISNKHQAQSLPKEKRNEAIEFFLPNDAISRLRQNSIIVEVQGRDRRAAMAAV